MVAARIYGRIYNPVTLYGLPWLICSLLAATGLFGIYQPAESTLLIISISIAGFAIGALASKELFEKASSGKPGNGVVCRTMVAPAFSMTAMTVICVAASGLSLLYLSRTVPLLMAGQGFEYIKFQYSNVEGATLFSTSELLLFQWLVVPIYYVAFIVFSYDLSRMILNKRALLFSIVGMVVVILVSGGRNSVFVFLVICAMGLFCSKERKSIWARLRDLPPVVKIAAAVAVLVLIYITQERSLSEDAGVLENVFFYFAGPIRYLDYILAHPGVFSIGDELFYGRGLFGFLINPIDLVCSVALGYDYQGTDSLISASASLYVPFSDELSGNALCTCIYPFIRDFGVAGVFVGPAIYGVLSSLVWGKAFPKDGDGSPCWKCIWIYFAYCLVFSEWRYTLLFPATGVAFFLVAIVFRRVRGNKTEPIADRRGACIG